MHNLTIAQLVAGLGKGEFSSQEITRHYLQRIEQLDPGYNSFISKNSEQALEQALAADQLRSKGVAPALCGIPIAHKDIFCTQGIRTSCGSKMLDNFVPPYSATVVRKLDQAGAVLLANEYLPLGAMLGIALVSLGLISITFAGGAIGKIPPLALRWGLATSVLIAAYTVADGMGVRVAGNPFSYIIWLFVLEPIPIGLWLLATDRRGWFSYMRAKPGKICAGALAAAGAYAMVIYAMSVAPMGMVSSLRETSVIFAALIGTFLFREPFGRQRIIAATLVCCGVVLIKILS